MKWGHKECMLVPHAFITLDFIFGIVTKSEEENFGMKLQDQIQIPRKILQQAYFWNYHEFWEVKSRILFNCSKTCCMQTPLPLLILHENVMCHFCWKFRLLSKFLSTFSHNQETERKEKRTLGREGVF